MRVDVVIEEGCPSSDDVARLAGHPDVRVITVPRRYSTARGTRFKARANHYAHEIRARDGEAKGDVWVLHMDDDTAVGTDTAVALATFINRQATAGAADARHLAQGVLAFPRELAANRVLWLRHGVLLQSGPSGLRIGPLSTAQSRTRLCHRGDSAVPESSLASITSARSQGRTVDTTPC